MDDMIGSPTSITHDCMSVLKKDRLISFLSLCLVHPAHNILVRPGGATPRGWADPITRVRVLRCDGGGKLGRECSRHRWSIRHSNDRQTNLYYLPWNGRIWKDNVCTGTVAPYLSTWAEVSWLLMYTEAYSPPPCLQDTALRGEP